MIDGREKKPGKLCHLRDTFSDWLLARPVPKRVGHLRRHVLIWDCFNQVDDRLRNRSSSQSLSDPLGRCICDDHGVNHLLRSSGLPQDVPLTEGLCVGANEHVVFMAPLAQDEVAGADPGVALTCIESDGSGVLRIDCKPQHAV